MGFGGLGRQQMRIGDREIILRREFDRSDMLAMLCGGFCIGSILTWWLAVTAFGGQ